ncbi:MAG: DoxX family protein [Candidatus Pacebacteria bacterium]|nr:DoxX family protein [Candidatus Paceibacterota bacterium]
MNLLKCKCSEKWQEIAPLILRIAIGAIFIAHGWQKIGDPEGAISGFFTQVGIPAAGFFAALVSWVEFLGGIALVVGFLTHWATKLLGIVMLVAIFTVHIKNGLIGPNSMELPLSLLAGLVSLMITGPGKYSMDCRKNIAADGNMNGIK